MPTLNEHVYHEDPEEDESHVAQHLAVLLQTGVKIAVEIGFGGVAKKAAVEQNLRIKILLNHSLIGSGLRLGSCFRLAVFET